MMTGSSFRYANVLMTVIFLISAAVQYNDPDGVLWILAYGAAAAVCIGYAMGRAQGWHAWVVTIGALIWAATLIPGFWAQVSAADLFGSMSMKTPAVERAREFGGLMIIAVWCTLIARRIARQTNDTRPARDSQNVDAG